jgi:hypothetical protein
MLRVPALRCLMCGCFLQSAAAVPLCLQHSQHTRLTATPSTRGAQSLIGDCCADGARVPGQGKPTHSPQPCSLQPGWFTKNRRHRETTTTTIVTPTVASRCTTKKQPALRFLHNTSAQTHIAPATTTTSYLYTEATPVLTVHSASARPHTARPPPRPRPTMMSLST